MVTVVIKVGSDHCVTNVEIVNQNANGGGKLGTSNLDAVDCNGSHGDSSPYEIVGNCIDVEEEDMVSHCFKRAEVEIYDEDQLILIFPPTFVMSPDISIQFGSFGRTSSLQQLLNPESDSNINNCEPVLIDLHENSKNVSSDGVDDINEKLKEQITKAPLQHDEKRSYRDAVLAELDIKRNKMSHMYEEELMASAKSASCRDEVTLHQVERFLLATQNTSDEQEQINYVSGVTSLEPLKKVVNEEHSDDQSIEDALEEFGHVMENKAGIEENEKTELMASRKSASCRDEVAFHQVEKFMLATQYASDEQEEISSVSAVTDSETLKTVIKEEHSDDQSLEDASLEEFGDMMENKADIKENEKTDVLMKEETWDKVKANEAQTLAEMQAQKKAQQREKRRLKRSRKKEKKRACGEVAELNKSKRSWGNMLITVTVLILSVLSFRNADFSMLVAVHN